MPELASARDPLKHASSCSGTGVDSHGHLCPCESLQLFGSLRRNRRLDNLSVHIRKGREGSQFAAFNSRINPGHPPRHFALPSLTLDRGSGANSYSGGISNVQLALDHHRLSRSHLQEATASLFSRVRENLENLPIERRLDFRKCQQRLRTHHGSFCFLDLCPRHCQVRRSHFSHCPQLMLAHRHFRFSCFLTRSCLAFASRRLPAPFVHSSHKFGFP